MKPSTSWPHIVLGLVGAAISAYAVKVHNLAKAGQETGCGLSNDWSCDKVVTSKWGEIAGIPLGFFGMLFFAIVIIMAIASKTTTTTRKQFALQNLAVSSVGFASSLALSYISIALIKAKCPVCFSTHAVTTTLFLVSLWQFQRARRAQSELADSPQS